MPKKKDLYEELLEQGFPKQSIHKVLHHLLKEQVKNGYKPKWSLFSSIKHFYYFKLYTLKPFCIIVNLKDRALALLKTQFAKKPKNPV